MNHKAVVTDLDGVIRFFPPGRDRAIESQFNLPAGALANAAFGADLLEAAIIGKFTDDRWRAKITQRLSDSFPDVDAAGAVGVWSDFPGHIDMVVLSYLRELAGDLPFALLTNATSRLDTDLAKVKISNHFSHIFNSSQIGVAKPEAEIFFHVSRELGLAPTEIIFVDDSLTNVSVAAAIGFRAFHFSGLERLKEEIGFQ